VSEVSSRAKGARRCTNPDCEFGGRWMAWGLTRLENGKFLCTRRECHTVYEAREVIAADTRTWVGGEQAS